MEVLPRLPDAFVFTAEIPRSSVGKVRKIALREQFADLGENPDAKAVFLKLRELRNAW